MANDQGFYEGIRGHKRLKVIEKQIARIEEEWDTAYEETPELTFLREEVSWEGTARLIFALAMRDVHIRWNGLRDYGFIRLCRKWIRQRDLHSMTPNRTAAMVKSILPAELCEDLSEELSSLDIS